MRALLLLLVVVAPPAGGAFDDQRRLRTFMKGGEVADGVDRGPDAPGLARRRPVRALGLAVRRRAGRLARGKHGMVRAACHRAVRGKVSTERSTTPTLRS